MAISEPSLTTPADDSRQGAARGTTWRRCGRSSRRSRPVSRISTVLVGPRCPEAVAAAIHTMLVSGVSNRGRVTAAERFADDVVSAARQAMADLLGADPGGIVFGRSMTQLTFDFSRALAKTWQPGDEVVVSRLDHDANIRPWLLAAKSAGAVVRWAEFDPATAELPVDNVAQ